jgi:hypothetical protein
MGRELTQEEKLWCLEQTIAIVKDAGRGGSTNMREAAGVLQNIYQTLCALRRDTTEDAQ